MAVVACLAPVAWLRFGPLGIEGLVYTAVSCYLPGLALAWLAPRVTGSQRAMALLLLGTPLRGAIVILAALAVLAWRPELRSVEYFLALAILYCIALAVETRQLLSEVGLTPPRQVPST